MDNINNKTNWKELSFKDKAGYSTAIASFILGWLLIAASFLVSPLGVIDTTTITTFGMALSYTGAILGISMYMHKSIEELKTHANLKK